jgi:flotillin
MDPATIIAIIIVLLCTLIIFAGVVVVVVNCLRIVKQGTAIVRNGIGGTMVAFDKLICIPVIHRVEYMDISVKRIEIKRRGQDGLICKDNIRADIEVAFFVRVNMKPEEVQKVAQFLGCERASQQPALMALFEPKFSEALKTVGKHFDFTELYTERDKFREEILRVIGKDLNGYVLDDASIDYLEQTSIELLNENNVLDAEGIKKITELTAHEQVRANLIRREREKTITKQDVEAREAILALERQQREAEEKQKREIAEIEARQQAEAEIVAQQERQRSELARISTDEDIAVADENRLRAIIVAQKNKERTDAVETERVEKDRGLEITERERVVTLAQIDKEKVVEVEKKNIQEVIRQRVMVERAVVEEQERIEDTKQFAGADRSKRVAVTKAEEEAEQLLVAEIKKAEAELKAQEHNAKTIIIRAEAERNAAEKESEGKKLIADAVKVETAAPGLAAAEVTERSMVAEAKGKEALAEALRREGTAEAEVMELKFAADAKGITQKAEAMKLFDGVGREHEEFKLRLNKDRDIELEGIAVQQRIAEAQASMIGKSLETAKIEIVGGDNKFFESIVGSITAGKQVDRLGSGKSSLVRCQRDVLQWRCAELQAAGPALY